MRRGGDKIEVVECRPEVLLQLLMSPTVPRTRSTYLLTTTTVVDVTI